MSKLLTLKPAYQALPYEDRLSLILFIRANRRIPKRVDGTNAAVRRTSIGKRAPTKKDVKSLISALTPEQIAALMAEFQEEPIV